MFRARLFMAMAVSSLIAGAYAVSRLSVVEAQAQAQAPSGTCADNADVAILPAPIAPWKGTPLRILIATEKPLDGELSLIAPDGSIAVKSRERHGGPPYFWFAEIVAPAVGTWRATLVRDGAPAGCSTITH
jgi:hypothetical protein